MGVPIGDLLAGMYGAYGVLAALLERETTGRGQVVRTSLLAAIVGVHAFQGTAWTVAGQVGRAQGNHHPSIAPYGYQIDRDTKTLSAHPEHAPVVRDIFKWAARENLGAPAIAKRLNRGSEI